MVGDKASHGSQTASVSRTGYEEVAPELWLNISSLLPARDQLALSETARCESIHELLL